MFLYLVAILWAAFIVVRQSRVRPLRRFLGPRFPIIFGLLGLIDLVAYLGDHHHLSGADFAWVFGVLGLGVVLGAARALTVRLWTSHGWVASQGTTATLALWAVTLGLHFYVDSGGGPAGASSLAQASLLLYLALTSAAQSYVLYRRATPMWRELGAETGPRFFSFGGGAGPGSGPGGMGAFFTNFGGGPAQSGWPGSATRWGSDVIDADVVEDDEGGTNPGGSAELPGPH